MKKVLLGVSLLAASLAFGTSSAMAAGTTASCTVNGATGNLSPSVKLVGGSGSFTFSGSATCQINHAPVLGSISASGSYTNTVCGTGTADGSASIPGFGTRAFHIDFFAGLGLVSVAGAPAGVVQLIPTGPDTSSGNCVSVFTVVGGFSVD